ncbi:MAG: DUF4190 domain-containing protein [Ignavibacteriaceae bacterium]|jgi:hypothetical protein|nr:MAG: DUF4190 domain-containing protein [Chlorobiota bacterium]KXK02685.1 MAG: hypothetical protein UZ04_CHB001001982 [Chlorobi bacterium OLB4]MBV6398697.1 hypothetical protein [Ignavibacteria bacterium]MCC6885133.1 DUF4190 domain-containing protein [Ignavibacteriales bacterium]MCE7952077.1 DUF4190 domain-containing protein [Chlorobi bacterium CHB7]MDL1886366.1 DUF4190 domain-containing protein [Ignavibacteria bacterium CHB1]MEB2329363.1 DUF4190 domain-containing protein [Ignavibacteriaceae
MNEGDNSFVPQPPPVNPSHGGASTNAILTLVFGILSWIMCPIILGIVAWVMGNKEINAIDSGLSSPEGRTLANIGKWLGIINTFLFVIGGILYLLFFVFIFGMATLSN